MPDTKITALAAITTVAPSNDLFPIVDVSDNSMAASGTTKNITVNQLLGAGGIAALSSATITGDLTVDTSTLKVDSALNKVGVNVATLTGLQTFNVAGDVGITSDLVLKNSGGTVQGYIFGSSGLNYRVIAGQPHVWQEGGSDLMRLNSTGLGVGASPQVKLTVRTPHAVATANTYTGGLLIHDEANGVAPHLGAGIAYNGGDPISWIQSNSSTGVYPLALNPAGGEVRIGGNVGIGVTPSATNSTYFQALEIARVGQGLTAAKNALTGSPSSWLSNNSYATYSSGIVWNYAISQPAAQYRLFEGQHQWFTAPSGTAGNAITFTQAMTLDASGNLLVGTTAAAGSASNSTKTVGGIFSSVNGTSASTASGSAVTLFASQSEATYMVSAYVLGTGAPATYNAVAIVKTNAGVATLTTISSATNLTISISGLNVQVTQTSGVSQVITYNVIRIS